VEFVLEDGKKARTKTTYNLPPLKVHKELLHSVPDKRIGSLDLETYENEIGIPKVYALGFSVLDMMSSDTNKCKTYFLYRDANSSEDLIVNCFKEMIDKYDNHTFYVHNLGRYDAGFILKVLEDYNTQMGKEYFKTDGLFKDSKPLKLIIKVKNKSK